MESSQGKSTISLRRVQVNSKTKLLGLFVFFLLIPPLGYSIVSSKTAAVENTVISNAEWVNGRIQVNITLEIDNPSLLPLHVEPQPRGFKVNGKPVNITSVKVEPDTAGGRNKTRVTIVLELSSPPLLGGFSLIDIKGEVCVRLIPEFSLLGFPGSVKCSSVEQSSVIEVGG